MENQSQQMNEVSETEFKKNVVTLIKSSDYTAELLNQLLQPLLAAKPEFFDEYKVDGRADAVVENKNEWVIGGYFDRHCRFLEQNFSMQRIEHLIQVKGHLIEYGIAGFSAPSEQQQQQQQQQQQEEDKMNHPFTHVDITHFAPPRSLQSSIASGELTQIRMALFMDMNDHRLSTHAMRQALAYALKNKPNLFVAFEVNGYAKEMEISDKSKWDAKYYALQEVYASSNFSAQRIEHMLAVREHVFAIAKHEPKAAPRQSQSAGSQKQAPVRPSTPSHSPQQKPQNTSEQERLKTMILIGGVVLAAVAAFILILL